MFFRLFFIVICMFSLSQINGQRYLEMQYDPDFTFEEIVDEANRYFDIVGTGRGSGYKQFKRWEYIAKRQLKPDGKIITALDRRNEFKSFRSTQKANTDFALPWIEQGPLSATNTSTWSSHIGRVSAVDIDPNDINHILVGSPSGGVWKSTDMGTNWNPIFDDEDIINIWSTLINYNDSDHYLVGTQGLGIVESTDGGMTWGLTNGVLANDKIISLERAPDDEDVILAIHEFGRVYRSTDGGNNWSIVLTPGVNLYDVEFKPDDPNTIYVSGRGRIYKSTDKGVNWTQLTGPWTTLGLMMGVTPHDAEYLYALQHDGNGGFGALYLSTDAGSTWTLQSDDSANNNNIMGYNLGNKGGQAPRDMDVVVSPTDKTEVHVAGISTFRSNDEGVNWTRTSQWTLGNPFGFVHADVDLLIYYGNTLFVGTDGGLFYSQDEAENFVDITTGLGVRQFYKIGVAQSASGIMVSGGSQDNGTGLIKGGQWYDWVGADGMETFISHSDSNYVWGMIQFGGPYVSTDGGNTIAFTPTIPGGNGSWVTPVEQDPNDPNTVYVGKTQVYKNTNGGAGSWQTISSFNNGNADEMKIFRGNSDIIYVSFNGLLFKTSNGGTSWQQVTFSPSGNINYIALHPTDPDRLSLALSGSTASFVESLDGGATWTDISDNLPNLAGNCVVYDTHATNGMYVGMTPGIYYKNDQSADWTLYAEGLPNVIVTELEIHEASNRVLAGTYGRGLWSNEAIVPIARDVAILDVLGTEDNYCGSTINNLRVRVQSLGFETLKNFTIDLYINDTYIASRTYGGRIEVNEIEDIFFPAMSFNEGEQDMKFVIDLPGDAETSNNEYLLTSTFTFGHPATLELTLDDHPDETTWQIKDAGDNIIYSGGPYAAGQSQTTISEELCLTEQCFTFEIFDSGSNGLNAPGDVVIYLNSDSGNPLVDMTDPNFGAMDSYGFCAPPVVVPPPCPLTATVTGTVNSNVTETANTINIDATVTDGSVQLKANNATEFESPFESNSPAELEVSRENCRVQDGM